MLKVENITKRYGNILSVDNITFNINKGEIVGLLGSNGAGKSTTMNMITGYIPPSSGSVSIFGHDMQLEPKMAKSHIGYLPEIPPLYLDMTVYEQLYFICGLKSIPKNEREDEIQRVCRLGNILNVKNRMIKNLSKGYRQRVGLSQALIKSPELLILDEPTVGLDPQQIIDIRDLIKELQKSHTIIISSHILAEISSICNRILVMKSGKLVADDTPGNLSMSFSGENLLELRIMGDKEKVRVIIEGITGVEYCEIKDCAEEFCFDYIVKTEKGTDIRKDVFFSFAKTSYPILMMKAKNPTLEDIFIQLTT